jgi:hypothetical protein
MSHVLYRNRLVPLVAQQSFQSVGLPMIRAQTPLSSPGRTIDSLLYLRPSKTLQSIT